MEDKNLLNILFICSPSIGLMDAWSPVLLKLRQEYPSASISTLFPRKQIASQLDTSTTVVKLVEPVIDSFIIQDLTRGVLYSCKTIDKAKEIDNALHVKYRASRRSLTYLPKTLANHVQSTFMRNKQKEFRVKDQNSFFKKFDAVFYDVYEHSKKYNHHILSRLSHVPKFSINHGLKPRFIVSQKNYDEDSLPADRKKTIAFLNADHEKDSYVQRFGVPRQNSIVTGVQRHDPAYIHYFLQSKSEQKKGGALFDDDYIFLISRPGDTPLQPLERIKKSIRTIRHVAYDLLNVKIVVKLHPKEIKQSYYSEILGEKEYGEKWMFSNAHPFTIGRHCLFAVSYYSGVAVDLIALDIPTIELLDLRGIHKYDELNKLRNKKGDPVLNYRYHGLVLGSSTKEEFIHQVKRVMNHREEVMKELRAAYEKMYHSPDQSIDHSIEAILKRTRASKSGTRQKKELTI